jgi:hypothetical protein
MPVGLIITGDRHSCLFQMVDKNVRPTLKKLG